MCESQMVGPVAVCERGGSCRSVRERKHEERGRGKWGEHLKANPKRGKEPECEPEPEEREREGKEPEERERA